MTLRSRRARYHMILIAIVQIFNTKAWCWSTCPRISIKKLATWQQQLRVRVWRVWRVFAATIYVHQYPRNIYSIMNYTSSTAQGGGGSFKNRKPIGEVGCCESRMAERIHWWTQRWLELCFLEWLQWLQWSPGRSPHPQLLDVVWRSAAVVVVVV